MSFKAIGATYTPPTTVVIEDYELQAVDQSDGENNNQAETEDSQSADESDDDRSGLVQTCKPAQQHCFSIDESEIIFCDRKRQTCTRRLQGIALGFHFATMKTHPT